MRRRVSSIAAILFMLVALATPLPTSSAEKHPAIRQAMDKLEEARNILQNEASRDFEGHRANAVKEINEALKQLKLALESDKD